MSSNKFRLFSAPVVALVLACAIIAQTGKPQPAGKIAGFDPARMDKTCEPCKDFYQFANGAWLEQNPVPAGYSRWGSFDRLQESNRDVLHRILETTSNNRMAKRKGSNEQLISDFYMTCMDEAKVEATGLKPLEENFARIESAKTIKDVQAVVAHFHRQSIPTLFGFGAGQDARNNKQVIGVAGQGGLSLPNRDHYTKDDEKSKKNREELVKHMTRMFELLGDDATKAAANAQTVFAVQTKLADKWMTPVDSRDPQKTYNKMTVAQFAEMTPNISWTDYFAVRQVPPVSEVNVGQPEFFKQVNSLMAEVPVADWKTYLRWHLITASAPFLSKKFDEENFNFYGRVLQGTKEQLPRWKRCVAGTDNFVGEALGPVYVKSEFTPESKARMKELIGNLLTTFRERLSKLDWMSEETRKQALVKLNAFEYTKIGYPDKFRDYTGLNIDRASYVENVRRAAMFENRRQLNKIGKPVDRTEWLMTPPTVNAYYQTFNVEIVFPAGILQPPFFNPHADDAINYGSIGGVIGHEVTHGFDDRGSQYDAQGNLRMWWTKEDREKFDARASCVADQFTNFKVADDFSMTGKLVQSESIADLGGLSVAYEAFQKSMEGKPRPANIDGFTPEQRFFLGWAQLWATTYLPEAMRQQALNGPHPISRFRANGPLSNMPQFAAAFTCKEGDPMVRSGSDRCKIW